MLKEHSDKPRIMIVDDEAPVRSLLRQLLDDKYECSEAVSAENALSRLRIEKFNLVISDIQMSGISGLEMIPQLVKLAPETNIIMISGVKDIESGIQAMRAGAFDYITKPFEFDHVETIVARALEHQALRLTKKLYENHLEELVAARTELLRQEILERRRAEEKINRMAYYDALTNLPNPALFKDRLTHEITAADDGRKMSATIFIGLDRFENINNTLGHQIGDEILRDFAKRLAGCIRKTDTAAYFGGGEFALLVSAVRGAEDCAKIAQKIKERFLPPFVGGGHEVYLTASLGISLAPDDGGDCQTLINNAATALRRARQSGGDNYQFYTACMRARALKSLSLENSMRRALEREEFVLHYQPQFCAATGKFTGVEALVRWQHPELGMIPPLDFISIAEDTGLIVPLGEWILRAACEQNARWQRAGLPFFRVGVNLSLRQFQHSRFVETISRILADSGLDSQYLELELTESVLMDSAELTIETLHRLRSLGIVIAIDDFGSGYSSLSYLKNLPVDALKIDQTFVRDLTADDSSIAIVKTIITLAQNLGLKTIAEGVETEEQSAILSNLGCGELQGYLFSQPLAAAALESFLSARQFGLTDQKTASRSEAYLNV